MSQNPEHLLPPPKQAYEQTYLLANISVLGGIACHLATTTLTDAKESWAVLSEHPPSLQTFALYGHGQRFSGIKSIEKITSLPLLMCCHRAYAMLKR